MATFTTPSGAVVDDLGNLISPPPSQRQPLTQQPAQRAPLSSGSEPAQLTTAPTVQPTSAAQTTTQSQPTASTSLKGFNNNQTQVFNNLLTGLLTKGQNISVQPFAQRTEALQRAQLDRVSQETTGDLRNLSPGQQASVRSGFAGAIGAEANNAAAAQREFQRKVENIPGLLSSLSQFASAFEQQSGSQFIDQRFNTADDGSVTWTGITADGDSVTKNLGRLGQGSSEQPTQGISPVSGGGGQPVYQATGFPDGSFIRFTQQPLEGYDTNKVFQVVNGQLEPVADPADLERRGGSFSQVQEFNSANDVGKQSSTDAIQQYLEANRSQPIEVLKAELLQARDRGEIEDISVSTLNAIVAQEKARRKALEPKTPSKPKKRAEPKTVSEKIARVAETSPNVNKFSKEFQTDLATALKTSDIIKLFVDAYFGEQERLNQELGRFAPTIDPGQFLNRWAASEVVDKKREV